MPKRVRHTAEERLTMLLLDLVAQYRIALKQSALRPSTQKDYHARVLRYVRTLPDGAAVADLDRPSARAYLVALAERAPNSAHSDRCALTHFGKWIRAEGWSETELIGDLRLKRKKDIIRDPVPDRVIRRLFAACEQLRGKRRQVRAHALLAVFAYAALRRFEVEALQLADLNFDDACITVRDGKGGRPRKVYPCTACMEALRAWIAIRPTCAEHSAVFTRGKRPMTYAGIYSTIKAVKVAAGLPDAKITPHMFRHSSATRDADHNVPITVIQAKLGHSQITTTARYIHSNSRLQKKYAELNSLEAEPIPKQQKSAQRVAAPARSRRVDLRRQS